MVIIYGSSLYGKVDEVPGLFYVATKFGHLWYIPLFPLGSHVVLEQTQEGWRGVPIGLSFKSLLVAWVRTACVIAAIVLAILAIVRLNDSSPISNEPHWLVYAMAAVAAIGLFIFTRVYRGISEASYKRAHQLGEKIGLNETGKIMLDLHFGIVSEQEAQAALEGLAEVERAEAAEAQADTGEAATLAGLASDQPHRLGE